VRADWRTAPVSEPVRATLGFLEKVTLRPEALDSEDAEAVYATGVSREALVDAIHIGALFNMIVRLADSFGWHVPPEEELAARADARLGSSYALLTPAALAAIPRRGG
jgi:alkylhydroperoxidase family enzyme